MRNHPIIRVRNNHITIKRIPRCRLLLYRFNEAQKEKERRTLILYPIVYGVKIAGYIINYYVIFVCAR